MEDEKNKIEKPANATDFHCQICNIYCTSSVNLQTHFVGKKHKAVEKVLRKHGIVKPESATGTPDTAPESLPVCVTAESETDFGKTLEEQLNSCRDIEPAIGLQYITEYQSEENLIYECNLCGHQSKVLSMFMHVLSAKHKLAYLTKHYPDMAHIEGPSNRSINKQLKKIVAAVEQKEGRQKIMVSLDIPTPKEDRYSVDFSDNLVTWFAGDNAGAEKKKKEDNSQGSGKMADETNKSQQGNKERQTQNTEQQLNDSDSEEFHSNEELLNYLKTFEVVNQDDAIFVLNITQKLTDSLVTYRRKVLEGKNTSELNVEERCDRSETTALNFGFSEKQPSVQYSCEDKGTESKVHPSKKWKTSPLSADDSAKSCQADAPMTAASESSISESGVIAEFFNSIRTMEVGEVAATLHKIAALNPSFNGMNIENVLKILTESGALKSKDSSSTS